MSEAFEQLQPYLERSMALQTAMLLFEWDNETLAPPKAGPLTSKAIGALSGEYQRIMTSEPVKRLLGECRKDGALTPVEAGIVRECAEELERLDCIPPGEYQEYARLTAQSAKVWAKAREEDDFEAFAPTLEEIIAYQKRFASYRAKEGQKLYDVMLDDYEKGFDMECLDRFFEELKAGVLPLLREVTEAGGQPEDGFLTGDYPAGKQEELARYLAGYIGFDFDRGVMSVSAHPFTTNLHNQDVRMTTHYTEKVDDSVFSVIHEAGHALYELGIGDDLTQTLLGQGASTGMHESQSRFFENVLGRSKPFWKPIYKDVQELFPEQLGDVGLDDWIRAVNRVEPGLIRIQADELTYSLHVLIRYEIEKMLIEEDLDVKSLPQVWADKYEEYLGVRPERDSQGVLQDIHWAQGSFGYFPTYALGSAFAAQIYRAMKREMDVDAVLESGDLEPIRSYLREKVHRFGKLKDSRRLLKEVTGEDFNPRYYVEYLREKYGRANA